jgi:hypothetical protein
MANSIVRCPYCVLGDDFRPMLPKQEGWFICVKCGHTATLEKPDYKCRCEKCEELNRPRGGNDSRRHRWRRPSSSRREG